MGLPVRVMVMSDRNRFPATLRVAWQALRVAVREVAILVIRIEHSQERCLVLPIGVRRDMMDPILEAELQLGIYRSRDAHLHH